MTDPVKASFVRRLDLMAVLKPGTNRLLLWISGVFAVWCLVGIVGASVASTLSVAPISVVGFIVSAAIWLSLYRAKRRVPETREWMDAHGL